MRQSEGMDNLYVCSIVAVNADTGELEWYYQNTPGDSWDYDSVQGFVLADLTIDGRERRVLMQANKNGFYYVLDRVTGAFITAEPFARINWASGIDPETGRPIVNPDAHYDHNGGAATIFPSNGGAHNWAPMSFNPNTGLVYIPASLGGSRTFAVDPRVRFRPEPDEYRSPAQRPRRSGTPGKPPRSRFDWAGQGWGRAAGMGPGCAGGTVERARWGTVPEAER